MNKKQKKLCLYLFLAFISGFLCSMILKNFEGFTSDSPPPNTGPPPPPPPPPPNTPLPNTGRPNTGPPDTIMFDYNKMDDEKILSKKKGGHLKDASTFMSTPPPQIMKVLDKMKSGIRPNKKQIEMLIDQMMIQMRG